MYDVSEEYLEAIESEPIQRYNLKLTIGSRTITDEDIVAGSFTIKNQCSDTDIVQIGSVYAAELKMTIKPDLIQRTSWRGAKITAEEGMLIDEEEDLFEYVPLGEFFVAEADHSAAGVSITAYDAMLRFDKTWTLTTTTGRPYNILKMLCDDCRVTLGMTKAEVEALTNGAAPLAMYFENDCQTYRDVLFWISQFVACFATIDRSGKLVLREYRPGTTATIEQDFRYKGATFSDFVTEYSGVSFIDAKSQEYIYVGDEGADTKLTYDLGANPFLQYGTMAARRQYARNILNALELISYTPFVARYLNTPAYDLGDIIKNAGGLGSGTRGCIMSYEYNFRTRMTCQGFGKNPELATAKDKTDKEIAGLLSKTDKSSIYFYTFKNAAAKTILDGDTKELINIRFSTTSANQVTFQAEILASAVKDPDKVVARVSYYLDGVEVEDYHPVETWSENGGHIISLYFMIDVEPATLYRWQVFLEASGGAIVIPPEHARATVWGQGLVAIGKWDGYIDAEDTFGAIPLDDITVAAFTAEAEAAGVEMIDEDSTADTFGAIALDDITVAAFEDIPLFNKESLYLTGTTWQTVKTKTWAQIKEDYTW